MEPAGTEVRAGDRRPVALLGRLTQHAAAWARALGLRADVGVTRWHVDRLTHFGDLGLVRGWAFSTGSPVAVVRVVVDGVEVAAVPASLPSPDVQAVHGDLAARARFAAEFHTPDAFAVSRAVIRIELRDGTVSEAGDISTRYMFDVDPYHRLQARFFASLAELGDDGAVLEIGSRSRSGNTRRDLVRRGVAYTGVDILDGDNVDVVGDAHRLSELVERDRFDAVFCVSTFEHLAMPWKVALEMGAVLKVGGTAMIATHQTFPVHDAPWDFWRFSDSAWHALFNAATGFEVLETALGERASVVADFCHGPVAGLPLEPAYLGSAALVRKVGASDLRWDVDMADITSSVYPQ